MKGMLAKKTPLVAVAMATAILALPVGAGASVKVHQLAELSGKHASAGALQGYNSAVSGNTLVVGALGQGSSSGVAFVFTKSGTKWTQAATLKGKDTISGDQFGNAVAISGSTIVVGAEGHAGATGAVYVFRGSGKSWKQVAELTVPPSGTYGQFGWSVAISGHTLVAGAVNVEGAAFVFTESGSGKWSSAGTKILANDAASGDGFGYNVAISGSTIFASAPYHNAQAGAVYVFTGSGTTWTQRAKLAGKDTAASDNFGIGELSASGSSILVGAPLHKSGAGAAYLFSGSGSKWTQTAEFKARNGVANDHFGYGGAISGKTVVIGSDHRAPGGVAYVFVKGTKSWTQQAQFTAKDNKTSDAFGRWVSLVGTMAVVGAPERSSATGATYIFSV